MDRALLMEHLAMAERHVTQGEEHVRRQRELVRHLATNGHDTVQAEDLLLEFERMLVLHKVDRDRIRAELAKAAK
jgi:hypothetical protein